MPNRRQSTIIFWLHHHNGRKLTRHTEASTTVDPMSELPWHQLCCERWILRSRGELLLRWERSSHGAHLKVQPCGQHFMYECCQHVYLLHNAAQKKMWCIALGPSRIIASFLDVFLGNFSVAQTTTSLQTCITKSRVRYLFQSDPHVVPLFFERGSCMSVPEGSPWGKPSETDAQPQLVIQLAFSYQPKVRLWPIASIVMHIQCAFFMTLYAFYHVFQEDWKTTHPPMQIYPSQVFRFPLM